MGYNTPRFSKGPSEDITFRTKVQDYQAPAYAAALTINNNADLTVVAVGPLTGPLTLNVATGSAYVGDVIKVLFSSAAGATVTTGTGVSASASTLAVAATKQGYLELIFNGTVWVEAGRTATA